MLDYGPDGNKYRYVGPVPAKNNFLVYHIYKGGKCLCSFGYGLTEEVPESFMYKDEKIILRSHMAAKATKPKHKNRLLPADSFFDFFEKMNFVIEETVHIDYAKQWKEFQDKQAALTDQWYNDIYKEYGLSSESPLVSIIFSKAYKEGHSAGYQEIEGKLSDLLDFAEDIIELTQKGHLLYS